MVLFLIQGSQRHGKSWKTWKMKKAFSRPGKIMEFEKRPKSWKNHGISKYLYGKIMENFFELHVHDPKKVCAARAHSFDDNKIGVVCFIFCGEGVTKRGHVEATVRKVK